MDATRRLGANSTPNERTHSTQQKTRTTEPRMRFLGLRILFMALAVSAALACAAQDAHDLAAQAKALVEAKDPERAFALLGPHEERLGGNPEFDYWLGGAALETTRLEPPVTPFRRGL